MSLRKLKNNGEFMKLKCSDSVVRNFQVCKTFDFSKKSIKYDGDDVYYDAGGIVEARCLECGKKFGNHDTKILKPEFVKHVCKLIK